MMLDARRIRRCQRKLKPTRVFPGAGGTLHQPVRVMDAEGQGLFHEQVFASIDYSKPNLGVELRRRADRHQIDAGIVQRRSIIRMASRHPGVICNPVKAREVTVDERDQLKARNLPQGREMALFDHLTASDYGQP